MYTFYEECISIPIFEDDLSYIPFQPQLFTDSFLG
jgi:hypothetical protein